MLHRLTVKVNLKRGTHRVTRICGLNNVRLSDAASGQGCCKAPHTIIGRVEMDELET